MSHQCVITRCGWLVALLMYLQWGAVSSLAAQDLPAGIQLGGRLTAADIERRLSVAADRGRAVPSSAREPPATPAGDSREDAALASPRAVPASPANVPVSAAARDALSANHLSEAEVESVIARAVAEARAYNAAATIAVVDRVGNVLAVFRMTGAATAVAIDDGITRNDTAVTGLDRLAVVPDALAAIAKAVTGAYLSTRGNAFSTRTAGQIIQEHFNPFEIGQPGGPLFGVQFSQLPCSDLTTRAIDVGPGPKRSPLGLAADPGGLPLYKEGEPVGAVGVFGAEVGDHQAPLGRVDPTGSAEVGG